MSMKKVFPLLLLLLISSSINAQIPINGKVTDESARTPLADVIVQYGSNSRDYVYSDDEGNFSIPANSDSIIHFQFFGYKTKSVKKSVLLHNPVVILELNPVTLNPVIISPGDADALLQEVMLNTKKKLLTDIPIAYILHFVQTKPTDTLKNEIYAKYATTLRGKDLKRNMNKGRLPYTLNIIDIKRVEKAPAPTSELYGAEYHASHLFTFGESKNNETKRSYTSDSSLIILQIEPLEGKQGWARGEIKINTDDMTISSIEIESSDSILDAQSYKRHMDKQIRLTHKSGRFTFAKTAEKYYMKDCFTYYNFHVINEFGREEDVSYYCDVHAVGLANKQQIKRRRLSGYCQELFYFPDSTQKEFWNEDYSEETYYFEHEFSGIAPDVNKSRKAWKELLKFGVPVIAVAALVK